MRILVNDQIHMSDFRNSDSDALIEYLNDREICDRTLHIPFPYTDDDAAAWFKLVAKMTRQQGRPICWAVRDMAEKLIGGCGFEGLQVGKSHQGEIGYWLARPYWGRGIMTDVVRRTCLYAFEEFGLVKITAHVFSDNLASARVLEKCGFEQEGFLRKHFVKEGRLIDARLFALLR